MVEEPTPFIRNPIARAMLRHWTRGPSEEEFLRAVPGIREEFSATTHATFVAAADELLLPWPAE